MLIKTRNGLWANLALVATISPRSDGGSNAWYGGGADDYHIFEESADELAALLNGSGSGMVELPRTDGNPILIASDAIASCAPYSPAVGGGEGTWIMLKGDAGVEYSIALPYAETKRRLGLGSA